MDKEDVCVHTHTHTHTHIYIYIYICITEYYSAIKNERMPSVAWMETEIIILR